MARPSSSAPSVVSAWRRASERGRANRGERIDVLRQPRRESDSLQGRLRRPSAGREDHEPSGDLSAHRTRPLRQRHEAARPRLRRRPAAPLPLRRCALRLSRSTSERSGDTGPSSASMAYPKRRAKPGTLRSRARMGSCSSSTPAPTVSRRRQRPCNTAGRTLHCLRTIMPMTMVLMSASIEAAMAGLRR